MTEDRHITRRAVLLGGSAALAAAAAAPAPAVGNTLSVAPVSVTAAQAIRERMSMHIDALAELMGERFRSFTLTSRHMITEYPDDPAAQRELSYLVIGGYHDGYYGPPERTRIQRLIAIHEAAWKRLEDSCNAADSLHPSYGGQAAEDRRDRLGEREDAAWVALLGEPALDPEDAKRKAEYLLSVTAKPIWHDLSADEVAVFLSAMAGRRA